MSESTRDRLVRDLVETKQPKASETPRTDSMIAALEAELGDGPPCISPAAIDVAVRLRLTGFARQLERELLAVRAKLTTALNMHNRHAVDAWRGIDESRGHVCGARRELEAIKNRSDQVMKDCAEWN